MGEDKYGKAIKDPQQTLKKMYDKIMGPQLANLQKKGILNVEDSGKLLKGESLVKKYKKEKKDKPKKKTKKDKKDKKKKKKDKKKKSSSSSSSSSDSSSSSSSSSKKKKKKKDKKDKKEKKKKKEEEAEEEENATVADNASEESRPPVDKLKAHLDAIAMKKASADAMEVDDEDQEPQKKKLK